MANDDKETTSGQSTKGMSGNAEQLSNDIAAAEWATFADEDKADRRVRSWAIFFAILFHVALLLSRVPQLYSGQSSTKKENKVYVVQQVRFRPPPPQQQQELPKPKAKKVPIPDPTPDEPEPIRLQEEVQPDINLPDTDLIFGIPEGPPPTEPSGPIMVGGDVKAPVKISGSTPQYTEIARRARIEGVVIVQAIVDKGGDVTNVKVLKGLPMGLDTAAVQAVKGWKFKPATLHGRPVDVYYTLTVNFQLN
jgi:protein TonB